MKKRRLVLINAVDPSIKRKSNYFEPRVLGMIAALTPDYWEIKVIDQNIEVFSYVNADLVAITSFTNSINEAYRIDITYRQNKIPVIIGGVHATLFPEEVNRFASSAVVGDSESTWPSIIEDYESGKLKPIYFGNGYNKFVSPKRLDYFAQYYSAIIETSRGCPMNCEFCSVPAIYKGKYYKRPITEVVDELKAHTGKNIFFSDDNMYGNSVEDNERFKSLCIAIINNKIKKNWMGFASIQIANDSESLSLAYKSGCKALMIGFEAEDRDILKSVNKTANLRYANLNIQKLIKKIQSYHIGVIGGFIFGFDLDSEESISERRRFIKYIHPDIVSFTPLTPLPGTKLFNKLKSENRLIYTNFPEDWSRYSFNDFVFKHPKLNENSLLRVFASNKDELYSRKRFFYGLLYSFLRTRSLKTVKHIYGFKNRG